MDDSYYPSPARTGHKEAPKLTGAWISSLVAAVCFSIALFVFKPESGWRWFFMLLGGIALFFALWYWLDWVLWRSGEHVQRMREAAYGPQLEMARIIQNLGPRQLEILQEGGYLSIYPARKLVDGRVHWMVKTPELDIPYAWICEYLNDCKESFPLLPVQHGLPDNTERARRRAFANLVASEEWGLAEWSRGNRACMWLVPNMAAVYDALGMSDS